MVSCLKKNLVFCFGNPDKARLLQGSSRAYCDNATKVMRVANVIFGQEDLTE